MKTVNLVPITVTVIEDSIIKLDKTEELSDRVAYAVANFSDNHSLKIRTPEEKQNDAYYGYILEYYLEDITGMGRHTDIYQDLIGSCIIDGYVVDTLEIKTIQTKNEHSAKTAIKNYLGKRGNIASFLVIYSLNRTTKACEPYKLYKLNAIKTQYNVVKEY